MSNTWKPSTASERIMVKFASHDPSVLVLIKQASFIKKAEGQVPSKTPEQQKAEAEAAAAAEKQRIQAQLASGNALRGDIDVATSRALGWIHGNKNEKGEYDWSGAKDLGIGAGVAGALYGGTAFVPWLRKQKILRAIVAAAGGIPAAVYGQAIRDGASDAWNWMSNKVTPAAGSSTGSSTGSNAGSSTGSNAPAAKPDNKPADNATSAADTKTQEKK